MPLFNCTNCAAVENTALSNYWTDLYERRASVPFNPLCSKCDPRIGQWHGQFPRRYEPVPDRSLAPGAPRLLNAMRGPASCDERLQGEDCVSRLRAKPASAVGRQAETPERSLPTDPPDPTSGRETETGRTG